MPGCVAVLAMVVWAGSVTAQSAGETPVRFLPASALRLAEARESVANAVAGIAGQAGFRNAHLGVLVVDPDANDTLYSLNADRLFVPASSQKLLTAAAAMATLGADFRFSTRLATRGIVRDGTLEGDLVVFGTGDPSFSDRMRDGDALAPLRDLADSLRARGILRIDGALRRGAPIFTDAPIGYGWAWEDLSATYGATVGDLMYNEAFTPVHIAISGVRDTAARPPAEYMHFLDAFYHALQERSVSVRAGFDWSTTVPDAGHTTLVTFVSPPLRDILPHFQMNSQNQIGEILLKSMGRVVTGAGRADSGAAVVGRALLAWSADSAGFVVRDGSGLSRHNWLSPSTLVRVLEAVRQDSAFHVFHGALPLAGVDGTLERRMRSTAAAGNVRAKSGSMDRVRALAGYVTTAGGRNLVFAVLINGYTAPARDVEAALDRVAAHLASLSLSR